MYLEGIYMSLVQVRTNPRHQLTIVPREFVLAPCIFDSTINITREKDCMAPKCLGWRLDLKRFVHP